MKPVAAVLFCLALLLFTATSWGAATDSRPDRRVPTRVSVLTMGPGDHPFSRFGHTALLLEWPGRTRVYNFGTFAFEGAKGVEDFLAGRFQYWLSVTSLPATVAAYRAQNRTLIAQDLNLTRQQRLRLAIALEKNARPENRYYDYDYYKDNCTTRVRDALDSALGGAMKRSLDGTAQLTFREHTERLSAADIGLYVALDAVLGRHTDQRPDRFGELWIPDTFSEGLEQVRLTRKGQTVPLVARTRTLIRAERPPPRVAPPQRVHWFGLAGLAMGGLFSGLGWVAAGTPTQRLGRGPRRVARVLLGGATALVGLMAGLLGTIFLGFWFTKHWAAHQNVNILLFAPWSLCLVLFGVQMARARPRAARWARRVLLSCTIAAVLGSLLALVVGQDSSRLAAFLVPAWTGLLLGTSVLVPTSRRLTEQGAPAQSLSS